jgi:hypothetical protein
MICKQAPSENISRISRDHTGVWAIIEEWVFSYCFLETDVCTLGHEVHVVVSNRICGHVVQLNELIQLESPCITSQVKIISSVRRVSLDDVVRTK